MRWCHSCALEFQPFPKAALAQGRIKLGVEQVFQPAGESDFLVALLKVSRGGRNWKVPSTRKLESLRYLAELDAAQALPAPRTLSLARPGDRAHRSDSSVVIV